MHSNSSFENGTPWIGVGSCDVSSVERSCLVRLFTRYLRDVLTAKTGISQRDLNYYDFWNEPQTQNKVVEAVQKFWEENIKGKWESTNGNCTWTYSTILFRQLILCRYLRLSLDARPFTGSHHRLQPVRTEDGSSSFHIRRAAGDPRPVLFVIGLQTRATSSRLAKSSCSCEECAGSPT